MVAPPSVHYVVSRVVQFIIVQVPVESEVAVPILMAKQVEFTPSLCLEDGPCARSEIISEQEGEGGQQIHKQCHKLEQELAARMTLIRDVVRERLRAAWDCRPPRLPGWLRAARNVAEHNFHVQVTLAKMKQYCSLQRGARTRKRGSSLRRPHARGHRVWAVAVAFIALIASALVLMDPFGDALGEYHKEFDDVLDRDKDGFATVLEFRSYIVKHLAEEEWSRSEIQRIFGEFDKNVDQKWDFQEALVFWEWEAQTRAEAA